MPDAAEAFASLGFVYGCSAGHRFDASTPGWEKLYCPSPNIYGVQCQRPLMKLGEPDPTILRDDLVDLLGELE